MKTTLFFEGKHESVKKDWVNEFVGIELTLLYMYSFARLQGGGMLICLL